MGEDMFKKEDCYGAITHWVVGCIILSLRDMMRLAKWLWSGLSKCTKICLKEPLFQSFWSYADLKFSVFFALLDLELSVGTLCQGSLTILNLY